MLMWSGRHRLLLLKHSDPQALRGDHSMSLSASQRLIHRLAPWALPVLLLAVWQLSVSAGWLSTRILPAPSAVIEAGVTLVSSGEIWTHLAISGWRAGLGFVIGGGIGLALGFITGLSKWGERLLDSSVQMIRNVPHLALIPLVILWFGIDETAKIFLVALGTLFPIYLNTYHGIRNIDPALVEMSRSYGLSGFSLFRHVILPGAMPSILVGVRFALGFMWLTLIVAETISASSGIGYLAMNAREFLQTDIVVLAIVLYAVLGKLADLAARGLERVCLRWHPAYQVSKGGAA
ncbi:Aliphatic sulfonates ABC transporter permease [Pseudomonas syringae pv. ribicola]|uniref:Aliphatic sulfonates ABC transporter permease n=4 Tax=Pseudomonas syringae group TaxID=136849 RepID=A0A0P9ZF04_PSESI|nr:Aliphatic sulfonates ABC transporter permease [Pseudomonas syringae pv. ribicola]